MAPILHPLIRSNIGILGQKIALLDALVARYGQNGASQNFTKVCPIVGASIGQHMRHSMDHVELAALVAKNASKDDVLGELHYDLRVRGGTLEKDLAMSRQRIVDVEGVFQSLQTDTDTASERFAASPINVYFNLSSDSDAEVGLPSTVARELGFAAHHAIHHLAMVKVIAVQSIGLEEKDLPKGFGRAPSTQIFEKNQT